MGCCKGECWRRKLLLHTLVLPVPCSQSDWEDRAVIRESRGDLGADEGRWDNLGVEVGIQVAQGTLSSSPSQPIMRLRAD